MNTETEFATVELILNTPLETRAIDAFALSIIKSERQVRRIFSYLIYQHPNYGLEDSKTIRSILSKNKKMYFENFISGITHILDSEWKSKYGHDFYNDLDKLKIYQQERNKIFHGQNTVKYLSREELIKRVVFVKGWCTRIENVFEAEIGFNGFNRNSFQKATQEVKLKNLEDYNNSSAFKLFLKSIGR